MPTLQSSGQLALGRDGGTTSSNSIGHILDYSSYQQVGLADTNPRGLAGVSSGQITMSNFYGKSPAWDTTMTVSSNTFYYTYGKTSVAEYRYGFSKGDTYNTGMTAGYSSFGSVADTTVDVLGGAELLEFCAMKNTFATSGLNYRVPLSFMVRGTFNSTDIDYIKVGSTTFLNLLVSGRTNGNYTSAVPTWGFQNVTNSQGNYSAWTLYMNNGYSAGSWNSINSWPFVTGTNKTLEIG